MKNKTDIAKLSDSELDDLILHGVRQQENVPRHGSDYEHWMNVVASAKEEKAGRDSGERKRPVGADLNAVADAVPDAKVEANPLSNPGAEHLHITPKGDAKATGHEPAKPRKTGGSADAEEIPEDRINQGLPGVKAGNADYTPENSPRAVTKAKQS